jgi:hypothetical protein
MENLNLHKQKLYALILAGVALISLFLPWATVNVRGFGGGSVNGLRGWGFLALLGVAAVAVASFMEDKTKEYMGNMKMVAMGGFGVIALAGVITFIRLMSAGGHGGELAGYGVSTGFGVYICVIAGVLGLLWIMGIVKMPPQKPTPPKP